MGITHVTNETSKCQSISKIPVVCVKHILMLLHGSILSDENFLQLDRFSTTECAIKRDVKTASNFERFHVNLQLQDSHSESKLLFLCRNDSDEKIDKETPNEMKTVIRQLR